MGRHGPVALAADILFDITPCDVLCQRLGQKRPAALEGLRWSNVSSMTPLWLCMRFKGHQALDKSYILVAISTAYPLRSFRPLALIIPHFLIGKTP